MHPSVQVMCAVRDQTDVEVGIAGELCARVECDCELGASGFLDRPDVTNREFARWLARGRVATVHAIKLLLAAVAGGSVTRSLS